MSYLSIRSGTRQLFTMGLFSSELGASYCETRDGEMKLQKKAKIGPVHRKKFNLDPWGNIRSFG